jgi:hypothetical protein
MSVDKIVVPPLDQIIQESFLPVAEEPEPEKEPTDKQPSTKSNNNGEHKMSEKQELFGQYVLEDVLNRGKPTKTARDIRESRRITTEKLRQEYNEAWLKTADVRKKAAALKLQKSFGGNKDSMTAIKKLFMKNLEI